MNLFRIYAALGVPEVWRQETDSLAFFTLAGKRYVETPRSRSFPAITPADILPTIQKSRMAGDQIPVLEEFRQFVRKRSAEATATKPT